jgi:hypothetical protein
MDLVDFADEDKSSHKDTERCDYNPRCGWH